MNDQSKENAMIARLLAWVRKPSPHGVGAVLVTGVVAGVLFWGAFNWAVEASNSETFCISCHEMENNVYQEFRETIHYSNASGVRATCPDCHVPKEWGPKVVRKLFALNELWHKAIGSIDTREKFQERRLELAISEWMRMKATDSHECRNCHDYMFMDFSEQGRRSAHIHEQGFEDGKTCIDCHKGIAHQLPPMDLERINEALAALDR